MQVSKNNIPGKNILLNQWQKTFGRPAPSGCHTSFLNKAIAWQQQAQKYGGLTAAERRLLMGKAALSNDIVHVGTHLVRVWQGETHQVTVLANGYQYKDQHWKSLSAIARAITGTPWSGPLFFGLKK
jgi:Protein of unknown function (DUF2924)